MLELKVGVSTLPFLLLVGWLRKTNDFQRSDVDSRLSTSIHVLQSLRVHCDFVLLLAFHSSIVSDSVVRLCLRFPYVFRN